MPQTSFQANQHHGRFEPICCLLETHVGSDSASSMAELPSALSLLNISLLLWPNPDRAFAATFLRHPQPLTLLANIHVHTFAYNRDNHLLVVDTLRHGPEAMESESESERV